MMHENDSPVFAVTPLAISPLVIPPLVIPPLASTATSEEAVGGPIILNKTYDRVPFYTYAQAMQETLEAVPCW